METFFEGDVIVLVLEGSGEVLSFFEGAEREGGFLLDLPRELKLFSRAPLRAMWGPEDTFDFEAEVIQSFPVGGQFRTAFQLAGWHEAGKRLAAALDPALAARREESPEGEARGAPERQAEEGQRPLEPPVVRLKRLNVTEKMLLAPKAERWERQVLLRDSSAQVLLALLNNPRMEDRELLELLKSVHVTSGLLQRVAKDRRWSTNYEVQVAIVRNPKTPTPLIMRLIDGLRTKDLQVLAKSSHVRESVRKAALKVYEKRK